MATNPGRKIPPLVEQLCLWVEETMLDKVGIFRVAGTANEIKKYRYDTEVQSCKKKLV